MKQETTPPEKSLPEGTRPEPQIMPDLRDPNLAALLGWLIPGCGHLYQRRWYKGILFMVCILGTFLYGFAVLGEGQVVYASFRSEDKRLPFLCQVGVGLPIMPALVQVVRGREKTILKPDNPEENNPKRVVDNSWNTFMAPPALDGTLSQIQTENTEGFELGTAYTMIAGLLNILAIYDAWAGPVFIEPRRKKKKSKGKDQDDEEKDRRESSNDTEQGHSERSEESCNGAPPLGK